MAGELELAGQMVRLTQAAERKTTRPRDSLKTRLATALAKVSEPVEHSTLTARFGPNVGKPLRELAEAGFIKYRVYGTLGRGTQHEYLPVSVPWRTEAEPAAAPKKHLTKTQLAAAKNSAATNAEAYEPWPFFSEKFLPYVKFMDARMQRRYRKTAAHFGIQVPA